jgi:hypothetical protein
MGLTVKSLIIAEARRRKKCAKNASATVSVALRKNNFTPARARRVSAFTSMEQRFETSNLLKGHSESCVGGP